MSVVKINFPKEISITREEFRDLFPPDENRRKYLLEQACWEYLRTRFGNDNPSSYCVFVEQVVIRAQKFLKEVARYNSDLGKLHREYIDAGRGVTPDYFGLRKKPWQRVLNRLGDALPYILPNLSMFTIETMFFPAESTPEELSMAWNIIADKIGLGDNM